MKSRKKHTNTFNANKWILVVEPHANYRVTLKSFLANLGFKNVKLVNTVEEARRELLTLSVAFIVSEWNIGETNGITFCRELKATKSTKDISFMLITAENLRDDVVLASEGGIDGYLLKPFTFDDFADSVDNIIRAKTAPSKLNEMLTAAELLLKQGQDAEASATLKKIIDSKPKSARAYNLLAQICLKNGELGEAEEYLTKAIRYNPEFIPSYQELASVYMKTKKAPELVEVAKKLNSLSPNNPKYTIILANAHLENNEGEEAEKYFKKSIRLSPKLAQAYKGLGMLNMIREEYAEAMKNFHKALDLEKGDASLLNSLGLAYVRLGLINEAVDKYRSALEISPSDFRILFNLGYAFERLGDLERAKFYYKSCLTYNPGFDKAKSRLEKMLLGSDSEAS
ncbi:MAG: tetratricopeptide repeat protein [Oligoflexales bacterium]